MPWWLLHRDVTWFDLLFYCVANRLKGDKNEGRKSITGYIILRDDGGLNQGGASVGSENGLILNIVFWGFTHHCTGVAESKVSKISPGRSAWATAQTEQLLMLFIFIVFFNFNYFLFFFLRFNFIYFWLHWVFIAVRRLSIVAVNGGYSLLWCTGFSLRWLLLLQSTGSSRAGFGSCGSWALECRLSSCGTRA